MSEQSIETRRKYLYAFARGVIDSGKGVLSIEDMFKIIEKELDKIYPTKRTAGRKQKKNNPFSRRKNMRKINIENFNRKNL